MTPGADFPAPTLILASASPRRAQLLRDAGYEFDVVKPDVDEDALLDAGHPPAELAERLSLLKARAGCEPAVRRDNAAILGGDTVVALGDRVYGKAETAGDARRILQQLTGRAQQVITGVTLITNGGSHARTAHSVTTVWMREVSQSELEDYIASGEWKGKAGAYGIQDPGMFERSGTLDPSGSSEESSAEPGAGFVTRIEGSYSNVVGLPMELVTKMLTEAGITPRSNA